MTDTIFTVNIFFFDKLLYQPIYLASYFASKRQLKKNITISNTASLDCPTSMSRRFHTVLVCRPMWAGTEQ